jgi:mono/diheme cytochrome c family protein
MRKIFKVALWGLSGIAVLAGGAAAFGQFVSERKLNRVIQLDPAPVSIPSGDTVLARGKYLYESRGCTDCHARDGAGRTFIDDGTLLVRGPNVTLGGPTGSYSAVDWVRSIRHGVAPSGKPLLIMPSEDYARMTDADLGAMIAYIRSLPVQAGDGRELRLALPVRFAYAIGVVRDAAEKIDHNLPPAQPVVEGDVLAAGAYAAQMCQGCHSESFTGGKIPGGPPDWPAAANLTPVPGGAMQAYRDSAAFAAMMRSGKRPDGSEIKVMPFESLAELNDTELAAMYAYFRSLTPAGKATGGR